MSARDQILSRRARFVLAALTGCAPLPACAPCLKPVEDCRIMATASLELDLPSCVGDRGTLRATRHDACDGGVAVVRPVIVSRDPSVVQVVDGAIVATGPGRTTLVVSVEGVIGDQQVDVVVQSCSETGGEVGAGDAADGSPG